MDLVIERLQALCARKGITGVQLGKALGLKKSPLTDWKNKKSKPTLDQIVVICEKFAISADYLLFGIGTQHRIPTDESEQELLDTYKRLDRRGQHKLHTVMYEEVDRVAAAGGASAPSMTSPVPEAKLPPDYPVDEFGDPLVPWAASGWADITPENAEKFQKKLQAFERESRAQKERAAAKDAAVLEELRKGILKKEK